MEIKSVGAECAERCQSCGKVFVAPVVNGRHAVLCNECARQYAEAAGIYCLGCGRLVGFISPGKAAGGYEVKPGETLHVAECPSCAKNGTPESSDIIEFVEFEAKLNGHSI